MLQTAVVPWVALWTSESTAMKPIEVAVEGVAIGERRDSQGIYWAEYGTSRGVGEPLFGHVHTRRQVQCMRSPKCQVCGEKLSHPYHWLLNKQDSEILQLAMQHKKSMFTQTPPVCRRCIDVAMAQCPHLLSMGKDTTLLEVRQYTCVGALGDLILPGQQVQKHTIVKYGERHLLPYFVGRQLIVELQTWKRIPL